MWAAETRDKQGRPVRDPGSVNYNAAVESAAGRDTDPQPAAFAQRVYREAQWRGFDTAARRVVLGDGAPWIWNIAAEQFPGAIEIVDIYPCQATSVRRGQGHLRRRDGTGRPWAKDRHAELDAGRLRALVAALRTHAKITPEARKCIHYVFGNGHRMRYPQFPRQGTVRRLGCRRGRMQADRRTPQARRHALDRGRRQRHHRPAMLPAQRALRRFLGATSRKRRLRGISQICRAPVGRRGVVFVPAVG